MAGPSGPLSRENVGRFQADKVTPWIGLRNAVGVALPLAIGAWMRALPSGLLVATGALNVAFSDSHVPYVQRARRMMAASVVVGCGVFVGTLCAWNHALIILAASVWAFAAGMLVALDQTAADLGAVSLVTLLVFAALPMRPQQALLAGVLATCGGLVQTGLSVALWPLRRYVPERRALGELFRGLADSASTSNPATESPPTTAQSTGAQDSLAALDRDHSLEAERYRALLSQAERIRLGLLVLARLRARIRREDSAAAALPSLDRFFALAADVLRAIAGELLADAGPGVAPKLLEEARPLAATLRDAPSETAQDARRQMDALAGQFRAALDLSGHSLPSGAALFERQEARQPRRLRLQGTLAILRANLSLQSAACRHAIRLAVCVAIGEALGQSLGLTRAYWAADDRRHRPQARFQRHLQPRSAAPGRHLRRNPDRHRAVSSPPARLGPRGRAHRSVHLRGARVRARELRDCRHRNHRSRRVISGAHGRCAESGHSGPRHQYGYWRRGRAARLRDLAHLGTQANRRSAGATARRVRDLLPCRP